MFKKNLFMFDADNGTQIGGNETDTKDTVLPEGGQGEGIVQEPNKIETLSKDDVLKMIQSETDKVRTDYSKKLKEKEKELENFKKEKMTEEERVKYELEQLKENLTKKEQDLLSKELTLQTIDLLKENQLPLEAKSFLMGSSQESTIENIKQFKDMFETAVTQAVESRFKSSGKDRNTGESTVTFYTQEMLKTMSADEINKNWEQIQRDLSK